VATGYNSYAGGDDAVAIGSYAVVETAGSVAIGSGATVYGLNSVAIGMNAFAEQDNVVSVGSAGAERRVVNVDNAVDATDAVNKRQLDAVVADVGGTIGSQLDSVATALGGGAAVNASGISAPSFGFQGGAYTNAGATFNAIDAAFSGLQGRVAVLETAAATPAPTASEVPMGTGDGLAMGTGSRAADANDTAVGSGARVGAANSVAVGSNAVVDASADNAVAVGADSHASASGAVALGQGAVADEANTVSVGNASQQRRITQVAAGTAGTDAANVAQMQDADAATLASANSYTDATATQTLTRANAYADSRLQGLNDSFDLLRNDVNARLNAQDKRLDRQGAMGSAMMNMAINAANSRSPRGRVAAGVGWQNGESALSVGYSKALSERVSMSIGGAFSSDDRSAGLGFGVDL
jgi:autotransporter adhesin